jgi:hypothetical protein
MTRTVTFNERVKLDHFDQIEDFEKILIWWGPIDYARFRAVCTKTVQHDLGTMDECDGDTFFCTRGLESWGAKASRLRRARIQAAIAVVLEGQQNLRDDHGITDGFAMATLYHQETLQDLIQARARGFQDEEAQQWERIKHHDDEGSATSQYKGSKSILPSARIKRRRSSEGKLKNHSISLSLQNFARKITSFPAA